MNQLKTKTLPFEYVHVSKDVNCLVIAGDFIYRLLKYEEPYAPKQQ